MFFLYILFVCSFAYLNTDTLLKEVQKEVHPNISFRVEEDILLVDWKTASPHHVLLVFNEHARERVTGELGLRVIQSLKEWNPDISVTIIPVLNVWGRKQVESGRPCVRKNSRGVDTNRNFQTRHVQHYGRRSEEYEGPFPLSEKESKLVSNELKDVTRYVNVHSGEYSLYMPYDASLEAPPNLARMSAQLRKWSQHCPQCVVGSAARTSSYKAYGTSVDWAIEHNVAEAYTFEIYGRETWDCAQMFNPKAKDLETILKPWLQIIKEVLT